MVKGGNDMSVDPEYLHATLNQLRTNLRHWGTTKQLGSNLLKQYEAEVQHLEDLFSRTLSVGESNSALVIAPRGTGKSVLVDLILERVESEGRLGDGLVVRLSGLMQTDDRLALREITQQLKLENVVANKVFGSFAENLSFMLESLSSGSRSKSKPVVFILDEFDLFCHHRNQTLLYNLFDVAQSAQAPICVIGLTCRLDVVELLEKRVKSRFSHRQIFLFPSDKFDPDFLGLTRLMLSLPDSYPNICHQKAWNADIKTLLTNPEVQSVLKSLHSTSRDIRSLQTLLLLCIAQLNTENPVLVANMFLEAQKNMTLDARTSVLRGLSTLQLCLVVAMKHLVQIYEGEPFNFEMVLHEYLKFSQRKSSMQSFDRPVVLKAFDQLQCLEIVRPVDSAKVQREYQLVKLLLTPSQIMEALSDLPGLPTDLQQWAHSALG
ncbi:origin recognition complex subunit 4 [Oratosquilla oratoria]|uniref:origin recognition complex subunit 4 n=1 Tax=Oratosquilla oratoria TaxID=337810 RepID=UPI003F776B19